MKNTYTAVVKQESDWWIGWIEEVPGVNCQEKSYDERMETLEITLKETLEFNRQDARAAAGSGYTEEKNCRIRRNELDRRLDAYEADKLRGRPAAEVIADIRKRL